MPLVEIRRARSGGPFLVARTEDEAVGDAGLRQPEAIALYQGAGYVRIPNDGYWADSPVAVCFEKPLGDLNPRGAATDGTPWASEPASSCSPWAPS